MKSPCRLAALFVGILFFYTAKTLACSGYKITLGGKTMVGVNEDAWRVTPHIWFETAGASAPLGVVFTGSRFDGANGYAPQSGMNEAGLCFQRLSSPVISSKQTATDKKPITNPTRYLKDILHQCKTVEEVQHYIRQYRQSNFPGDVFLYVDKSGKYLTVEPYTMTLGDAPKYVVSNFCPSVATATEANRLPRYRDGTAFLQHKTDTTLAFCRALSDTMHVCRKKAGDGTLLTSVYDLNAGVVNLYFYHDYESTVRFNLKEELKKGDHSIAVASLFPLNKEFEKLRTYQTPHNNSAILLFLLGCIGLSNLSALCFTVRAFRLKFPTRYWYLLLLPATLFLGYYLFHLLQDSGPFYFPAPYKDPYSPLISAASYLPFALLLSAVPLGIASYKLFRNGRRNRFSASLLCLNVLAILPLLVLFWYWGFYSVG